MMRQQLSIQRDESEYEYFAKMAKPMQITSLGGLSIHVHGRDIGVQSWKSPKVYQLLDLIVGMGGKNIAAHRFCDAIWPGVEGDRGMQNLEFILRRLRQVLQTDLGKDLSAKQVIQFHQGKVSLNADYCDLDIWKWQNACARARQLRSQRKYSEAFQFEQQAAVLLSGDFLAGDDTLESTSGCISRWRTRCCGWLDATLTYWRKDECCAYHQMSALFDIWLQIDPASERLCIQRMQALLDESCTVEALRVYYDWVQLIKEQYGLNPSAQTIVLANKASNAA